MQAFDIIQSDTSCNWSISQSNNDAKKINNSEELFISLIHHRHSEQ